MKDLCEEAVDGRWFAAEAIVASEVAVRVRPMRGRLSGHGEVNGRYYIDSAYTFDAAHACQPFGKALVYLASLHLVVHSREGQYSGAPSRSPGPVA